MFPRSIILSFLLILIPFIPARSQGWNVELAASLYNYWEYAFDVVIDGNYAYVATRETGLSIVNVSNPADPLEVGYCDTPGYALGVAVSGDYAYVADYDAGLRIVKN